MLDDGSPSPPASKFSHNNPMEPMHEPFYIQSVRKYANDPSNVFIEVKKKNIVAAP